MDKKLHDLSTPSRQADNIKTPAFTADISSEYLSKLCHHDPLPSIHGPFLVSSQIQPLRRSFLFYSFALLYHSHFLFFQHFFSLPFRSKTIASIYLHGQEYLLPSKAAVNQRMGYLQFSGYSQYFTSFCVSHASLTRKIMISPIIGKAAS